VQDARVDLDLVDQAIAARRMRWTSNDVSVELVRDLVGGEPASSLRAESPAKVAELLVLASGDARLTFGEIEPAAIDTEVESYSFVTTADVEEALDRFEMRMGLTSD
jgi:hypothetical protein